MEVKRTLGSRSTTSCIARSSLIASTAYDYIRTNSTEFPKVRAMATRQPQKTPELGLKHERRKATVGQLSEFKEELFYRSEVEGQDMFINWGMLASDPASMLRSRTKWAKPRHLELLR